MHSPKQVPSQAHFSESETVELKVSENEGVLKEIVAFANCDGGTIYIGIADDGEIVGVDNPDGCALSVSNMVRDSIKPDVTMFVHYETLEIDNKHVIKVSVQRGTNRPYYIAKKGLRPAGVYVRQGFSSVPSTDSAIRNMIKETDGDSYENMRSVNQKLTFDVARAEFSKRKVKFEQPQMKTLKVISDDGLYTNLALLLSDQCPHSVKVAVFEGVTQEIFKDRREFFGSLLQQLNDVYDYIDIHNQTRATFDKLLRIDEKDYPEVALREALLNALVHRDYSFAASTLISIYNNRIEFVSIGGLMAGLELEDVMMGVSVCRNPHLANVFYRLQLIEAYGTGMKKIMAVYKGAPVQPEISATNNAFKVILPNVNAVCGSEKTAKVFVGESHNEHELVNGTQENTKIDDAEDLDGKKVIQLLQQSNKITRKQVQEFLGISQSSAGRLLRDMVGSGQISRFGKGRSVYYGVAEEKD